MEVFSMIEIGMTYTVEATVTPNMTAKAVGSGGLEAVSYTHLTLPTSTYSPRPRWWR